MYVSRWGITNFIIIHGFIKLYEKKFVLRGVPTPRIDVGNFLETSQNPVSAQRHSQPKMGETMNRRISLILSSAFLALALVACSEGSPLSAIPDCAGVPGGSAVVDDCGVCNGDNTQCADCNGVAYGDGLLDNKEGTIGR